MAQMFPNNPHSMTLINQNVSKAATDNASDLCDCFLGRISLHQWLCIQTLTEWHQLVNQCTFISGNAYHEQHSPAFWIIYYPAGDAEPDPTIRIPHQIPGCHHQCIRVNQQLICFKGEWWKDQGQQQSKSELDAVECSWMGVLT